MTLRFLLHRLTRNEKGVALVEFAMVLPILLLLFGVTIEGARTMWSYQSVIAGVRDASRYLGRVVSSEICILTPSANLAEHNPALQRIVAERLGTGNGSGGSALPQGVTVNSVTSSLDCTIAWSFPDSPRPPVATVTADVTITLPFAALINWAGGGSLGSITTRVTDRARVFGS